MRKLLVFSFCAPPLLLRASFLQQHQSKLTTTNTSVPYFRSTAIRAMG